MLDQRNIETLKTEIDICVARGKPVYPKCSQAVDWTLNSTPFQSLKEQSLAFIEAKLPLNGGH